MSPFDTPYIALTPKSPIKIQGDTIGLEFAFADNALLRGDIAVPGIQDSGWLLDDDDNMLLPTTAKLMLDNVNQYLHASSSTFVTLNAVTGISFDIGGSVEAAISANALDFANGLVSTSLNWGVDGTLAIGVDGVTQVGFTDGTFEPVTTNDISHGTTTKEWASGWYEGEVKAGTFKSDVTTGTAPLIVASETVVANLNADSVDGAHVGTSGAAIPLLSTENTWGANQLIADGFGVVIGHTAQIDFGATPEFQVLGTEVSDSSMGFAIFNDGASNAPDFRFLKSRGLTLGTNVLVQDGDRLGRIRFQGADGNDFNTTAAEFLVEVDGVASLDNVFGRFVWRTRTSIGGLNEKMSLSAEGTLDIVNLCKASTYESDVGTGTAPLVVASETRVANLNVTNSDQVDGKHVGTSGDAIPLLGTAQTWSADQLLATTTKLQFRDSALSISSPLDGFLKLSADIVLVLDADIIQFGTGDAGKDAALQFIGETNSGGMIWMEDEDYLNFLDDILINASENIYFRDTAIHIASETDGHLDIEADISIDFEIDGTEELVITSGLVDVPNNLRAGGLYVDGDSGGISGTLGLTNATLGAGSIPATLANVPVGYTAANKVWLKFYNGATVTVVAGWQV